MTESTSNPSSLNDFQPETIDELSGSSPATVVESFSSIKPWESAVTINNDNEQLLVGESKNQSPRTYSLYYDPLNNPTTPKAGEITHDPRFYDDESEVVAFVEQTDEEQTVAMVESLTVLGHDRMREFERVLPYVRSELTNLNWVNGFPDPDYETWGITAPNALEDFNQEFYDGEPHQLPVGFTGEQRVIHALFRYPLDPIDVMGTIGDCVDTDEINPEMIRVLFLDYAIEYIPDVDVTLDLSTVTSDL